MRTTMPRAPRRLVAVLAVAGLALAACGGDDDSSGGDDAEPANELDAAYAQVLAAEFTADPDTPFTQEQADCLAVRFVDIVGGGEAFRDLGIEPDDIGEDDDGLGDAFSELGLSDAQAAEFGASLGECGFDFVGLFADDLDASDEAVDCLREQLTDEVLGQLFVSLNQDDDDAMDAVVFDAIEPCIPLLMG